MTSVCSVTDVDKTRGNILGVDNEEIPSCFKCAVIKAGTKLVILWWFAK